MMESSPVRHRSSLAQAVFEFAALLDSHRLGEDAARSQGLTLTWLQVRALWHIGGSGQPSQAELAAMLGTSAPTTSKLCGRLEVLGYVIAVAGRDRRVRQVTLTEEGRRVTARIYDAGDELIRRLAARLAPERAEMLGELLSELLVPLREEVEGAMSVPERDSHRLSASGR